MPKETQIQIPNSDITIPLIYIEGGSFMMGDDDYEGWQSEVSKPAHKVHLDSYWLGKYPITQAQWRAVLEEADRQGIKHELDLSPSGFQSALRPVEQVSWLDCMAWLDILNLISPSPQGKGLGVGVFSLPSEAQWEYAARGGIYWKDNLKYSGSNDLWEVGWYRNNSHRQRQTQVVGLKKPNQLGLYDMSGNVWEWCLDEYKEDVYKEVPENFPNPVYIDNAINDSSKTTNIKNRANKEVSRLLRGGSWDLNNDYCSPLFRYDFIAKIRFNDLGFRLVAGQ